MTSQNMEFRRILGFTASGRNSFVTQPKSGNLIYIAGCVIIVYNPHLNIQKHLLTESKQTITTLAISEGGRYLAAADSGSEAMIRVWDLLELSLLSEIEVHDFEFVTCMSFSGDGHILMSIGSHYDYPLPRLKAWNWRTKSLLIREYVSAKTRAVSCEVSKGTFVIVGEASVQYWSLSPRNFDNPAQISKPNYDSFTDAAITDTTTRISINRWDATLGIHRDKSFCDVKCGRGPKSGFTFCIAKDGLLCELNQQGNLHKFVDLKTTSANCLGVSDNLIAVGCANGLIRCFTTTELKFIRNIPRPHKLGLDITPASSATNNPSSDSYSASITKPSYPDVISVIPDEINNAIVSVYNDRSMYIWDISNPNGVVKKYSALYHSSCIWGVDMYPPQASDPLLPFGSFITCSSDDTIRIWQPKACNSIDQSKITFNSPVEDSIRIIFTDSTYKFLCNLDKSDLGGNSSEKQNQDYDSNEGLRCLKISPNGRQLAVGSRSGAIKIYDLTDYIEMKNIAAHDAEVLCLEYSDPKRFDGFCYLASSSRDKLIHIFDVTNDYSFLQTIDDHLSTITSLKFVNNIASDSLQLVSCGADKKIIFRYGTKLSTGQLNFVTKQFIIGKSTFYDMEVDSESSCLMTACQDRMIRLFNVAQMKYQSSFKGSFSDDGTLIKIALDPSCTFLAASSTNKTINIYDYQRGECIASVANGLSDLVTDLKFSLDGRYLVACSGDGCIFIWASPAEIANAIGHNLSQNIDQLSLSSCSLGSVVKPQPEPPAQVRSNRLAHEQVESREIVEPSIGRFVPKSDSGHSISGQYNDKLQTQYESVINQRRNDSSVSRYKTGEYQTNLRKSNSLGLSKSAHILNHNNDININGTIGNSHRDSSDEDEELSKLTDGRNMARVASGNLSASLSAANKNKPSTPPKSSLYKQISRRGGFINQSGPPSSGSSRTDALDYNQHSGHYMGSINSNRSKTLASRARFQGNGNGSIGPPPSSSRLSSTMRPARSECNLEMVAAAAAAAEVSFPGGSDGGVLMSGGGRTKRGFIYSEKLDLSRMNPADAPISQELCQYVVDELQAIAKYSTRLHQSLLSSANNRHLSGLLARGVQNAMDILSIVPPRVAHQRQFQSQVNLTSSVNMIARNGGSRAPAHLQRGSSALSAGQLNYSTAVQPLAGVSTPACGQKKSPPHLLRKPNKYTSPTAETKARGSGGSEAAEEHEGAEAAKRCLSSDLQTSGSSAKQVDQVLESYADRLFRMIQERCDQSGSASNLALSPTSANKP